MKQGVEELEASRCRSEDEEDSEDSNETDHDAVQEQKRRVSVNRSCPDVLVVMLSDFHSDPLQAAPEIDWRSISDPAERRRQRRLAKNRLTAAKSRERKKVRTHHERSRIFSQWLRSCNGTTVFDVPFLVPCRLPGASWKADSTIWSRITNASGQ
jgi:hypothetical protein